MCVVELIVAVDEPMLIDHMAPVVEDYARQPRPRARVDVAAAVLGERLVVIEVRPRWRRGRRWEGRRTLRTPIRVLLACSLVAREHAPH